MRQRPAQQPRAQAFERVALRGAEAAPDTERAKGVGLVAARGDAFVGVRSQRAAHEAGVIHRDLKPSNIFLAADESGVTVKLLDFGIAYAEGADRLTAPGMRVGTARYMAPEVIGGAAPDARADVWAAGIVLYEALAGRNAYPGRGGEVLRAILNKDLLPITTYAPDMSAAAAEVVHTALARDPAQRFQSAGAFRAALLSATQGAPPRIGDRREYALGTVDLASEPELLQDEVPAPLLAPASNAPTPTSRRSLIGAVFALALLCGAATVFLMVRSDPPSTRPSSLQPLRVPLPTAGSPSDELPEGADIPERFEAEPPPEPVRERPARHRVTSCAIVSGSAQFTDHLALVDWRARIRRVPHRCASGPLYVHLQAGRVELVSNERMGRPLACANSIRARMRQYNLGQNNDGILVCETR